MNINILSESEWRLIHNALSVYQSWGGQERVDEIQQLMDKVRDNYIAPTDLQDADPHRCDGTPRDAYGD